MNIDKLKSLLTANSKLVENFVSLFSIQIFNYLLPLITFPYLIRVLGIEFFGLVTFIQSTIIYFNSFTAYGFKLTGTDLIAKNVDNKEKLDRLFSAIIGTKLLLFVLSFVIIVLMCLTIDRFGEEFYLFLIASFFIFGNLLFPEWFFQGVQEMKFIATFNVVAKLIFTILIFIIIRDAEDYPLVIILNSLSFMIGGIFSFCFAIYKFKIKINIPSISEIVFQIKNGFYVFVSSFSVQLYTTANFIVLGILLGDIAVGIYSIGYKIFSPIAGLSAPFNRSIFPKLSQMYKKGNKDGEEYRSFAIRSLKFILPIFALGAIIVFIAAPLLIKIVSGDTEGSEQSVVVLRILSIAIVFFPLGPFFTQLLVIQGLKKELLKVIFTVGIINAVLLYPVITNFGVVGLSCLTVVSLGSIGLLNGVKIWRNWQKKED